MLPFLQIWPLVRQRMYDKQREKASNVRKNIKNTPATQPRVRSKRFDLDNINTLFNIYHENLRYLQAQAEAQAQDHVLLKSPVTIFIIDDSSVVRRMKKKQVREMFANSSDLRIVSVASAEKAIEHLQAQHAKEQPPLLIFTDRSFFLEGQVTSEAETMVLKEIKRLYGESVGIVSISNEYISEKTETAESQVGTAHPEEIHFATKKKADLNDYRDQIKSCIMQIIKKHGKPACRSVSNSEQIQDEKERVAISTISQAKARRRGSVSQLEEVVTTSSSRGDSRSVPATLKSKKLHLTEATIVLIGEDGEETDKFKKSLLNTFDGGDSLRFIMATDLKEAKESFSRLHKENSPPDLVFTVDCGQDRQAEVSESMEGLFNNVKIVHHTKGVTADLKKIHEQMIGQALQQQKAVCLQQSETPAVSPKR